MPIKSDIHVQLGDSNYIRKNILGAALNSNQVQQSLLAIKELQTLKRENLGELRKKISEVVDIVKTINLKEFPEFDVKKERVKIEITKERKGPVESMRSSEERDLMRELEEIKSKIDSISL